MSDEAARTALVRAEKAEAWTRITWSSIASRHRTRNGRTKAEQKRLDRRERRAGEALLSGISAYLRALSDEDEHTSE
jgi:hypothetical protein